VFENFKVDRKGVSLVGYHWPVQNPNHVVCLIHGVSEHDGRYDRMATYFNEAGIAVMGMDLRGHGLSTGKRGDASPRAEVLKDVDALLKHIEDTYPGVPVVMYGHSMGGNITLDYRKRGLKNDVPAGYVISAPWVLLCRNVPKPLYTALNVASKVVPKIGMDTGISQSSLGNKKNVEKDKDDVLMHHVISLRCASEGFKIGMQLYEGTLEGNNAANKKPLLLMHGTEDRVCRIEGSRAIAAKEPDIKYVEWEGLYHEIHNGGAESTGEEVIQYAINFIKSV